MASAFTVARLSADPRPAARLSTDPSRGARLSAAPRTEAWPSAVSTAGGARLSPACRASAAWMFGGPLSSASISAAPFSGAPLSAGSYSWPQLSPLALPGRRWLSANTPPSLRPSLESASRPPLSIEPSPVPRLSAGVPSCSELPAAVPPGVSSWPCIGAAVSIACGVEAAPAPAAGSGCGPFGAFSKHAAACAAALRAASVAAATEELGGRAKKLTGLLRVAEWPRFASMGAPRSADGDGLGFGPHC